VLVSVYWISNILITYDACFNTAKSSGTKICENLSTLAKLCRVSFFRLTVRDTQQWPLLSLVSHVPNVGAPCKRLTQDWEWIHRCDWRCCLLCSLPRVGALSYDACLTSDAYIGPNSRTERPRKTKIGTEVAHVTRDSDTTFKVKTSKVNLQGAGAYRGGLPQSLFPWAWSSAKDSPLTRQFLTLRQGLEELCQSTFDEYVSLILFLNVEPKSQQQRHNRKVRLCFGISSTPPPPRERHATSAVVPLGSLSCLARLQTLSVIGQCRGRF